MAQESDLEIVRRTLILPTREDYPYLKENPKAVLNDLAQKYGSLELKFQQVKGYRFSCNATFTIDSHDRLSMTGEGNSKKEAEQIACFKILSEYHQNGKLKILFGGLDTPDNDTMQAERDAKIDIHNYAARYGLVPKVSTRQVSRRVGHGNRKVWEITVELPEQGIKVSGLGIDRKAAEVGASLKFKKEAEKYQAQQGKPIVVRDFTAVNTSNVRDFLKFYKAAYPGSNFDCRLEPCGASSWSGIVSLNGTAIGEPTDMTSKKGAEDLAYLSAGIALSKHDPQLWEQFQRAPRTSQGELLQSMPVLGMFVDQDCLLTMRKTLHNVRKLGLPDEEEELTSDETMEDERQRYRELSQPEIRFMNKKLQDDLRAYYDRPDLAPIRKIREQLPMNQYQQQVLDIVQNMYCIIIGATGSGKTTQVPQILLEEAIQKGEGANCNIICTQPRRIAATSVAKRVAEERGEPLRKSVGYHVRFQPNLPRQGGSITYCTTGILLQRLKHDPDGVMDNTSHLIIDEVHERDIMIDFLLIMLKRIIAERTTAGKKVPKVILMSATIDADLFASYFNNDNPAPHLSVPGRTFPVKEIYFGELYETLGTQYARGDLELLRMDEESEKYCQNEVDYAKKNILTDDELAASRNNGESIINWKDSVKISGDETELSNDLDSLVPTGLVATTIAHICKISDNGAVLVFLPGLAEIIKVKDLLESHRPMGVGFSDTGKFKIYTLHSTLQNAQDVVFDAVPPDCRKVILATNIAETSITIPDVQYVVDTGKQRENQYDPTSRITQLKCCWISKSNSKQRAGRAGRVQNGSYYALFTESRYRGLRAVGLPELLRSDLQETCLDIKHQAFKIPIREFLSEALEPPAPKAVDLAVQGLVELDALTEEEDLTSLGRLLASLPVNPSLGKMIILGIIFRCLDPMILIGAAHTGRSLFLSPLEQRQKSEAVKKAFAQGTNSDHMAFINAMRELRTIEQRRNHQEFSSFAYENFLHIGTYRQIRNIAYQIEEILIERKLISGSKETMHMKPEHGDDILNQNSHHTAMVTALIMAGVTPNIASSTGPRTHRTRNEKNVLVHPGSVNAVPRSKHELANLTPKPFGSLHCFSAMSRSSDGRSLYLNEVTEAVPLIALLFGGQLQTRQSEFGLDNWVQIDNWLPFYIKSSDPLATRTIVEFRKALMRVMSGAFKELSLQQELARSPIREAFAMGLKEVLDRDSMTTNQWQSRSTSTKTTQDTQGQRGAPAWNNTSLPDRAVINRGPPRTANISSVFGNVMEKYAEQRRPW